MTQQARFALLAPATRLFDGFSEAIRLTRTRVVAAPNVTHLRYRVVADQTTLTTDPGPPLEHQRDKRMRTTTPSSWAWWDFTPGPPGMRAFDPSDR